MAERRQGGGCFRLVRPECAAIERELGKRRPRPRHRGRGRGRATAASTAAAAAATAGSSASTRQPAHRRSPTGSCPRCVGASKKEYDFERAVATIRSDVARAPSPVQIAQGRASGLKARPTSIYRRIAAGCAGMPSAELRRKVGCRPRCKAYCCDVRRS